MYNKASGPRYQNFLSALHSQLLFDWYLEVGCRTGESFAPVRSKTVAIDPFFRANINIIGCKPSLHIFQTTSDEFFASNFLEKSSIQLSLSFLDGMHLFEYLLRDFMNAEANSDPQAVIMMHDCAPRNLQMTTRDLTAIRGAWTGDVWKLVPILKAYRPELKLVMLDCHPTGLLCVSNLSPGNNILRENYAQILSEFMDVDLETFGVKRFYSLFNYTSAQSEMDQQFPHFIQLALDPLLALEPTKIST